MTDSFLSADRDLGVRSATASLRAPAATD